jgi:hypothetical protein
MQRWLGLPNDPLSAVAVSASNTEKSKILGTLPEEKISRIVRAKTPRGVEVTVFVLSREAGLEISIKCRGCPGHEQVTHGIHSAKALINEIVPKRATLIITAGHSEENGRYIEYVDAGSKNAHRKTPEPCLLPRSVVPMPCALIQRREQDEQEEVEQKRSEEAALIASVDELRARQRAEQEVKAAAEEEARAREAREKQESKKSMEREAEEREARERAEREAKEETIAREKLEREEREAKERDVIKSVDNTKDDLAPYEGEFRVAYQPFVARSEAITYAGVTIGNPEVPLGVSAYKVDIRICTTRDCSGSGSELADKEAEVDNYGLTAVGLGEIPVTPEQTYYLVWSPPEEVNGAKWVTFWHAGEWYVGASSQMEAVVRGFNQAEGEPSGARISYLGTQPPPAPYSGRFIYAFQNFKAASNEITKLGVVIGNPKLTRGKETTEKVDIRLCTTAKCTSGPLASGEADIVNYGVTEVHFPGVAVVPDDTYYVNWEAPEEYEGEPWVTFWFGKSRIEDASATEAFAAGYDEGPVTYTPIHYQEMPESNSITTFGDYENATDEGKEIQLGEAVEVSCKVFAPEVESVEPEGFWYRIHSEPWNDNYYAAANAFRNIGGTGEGIDTDPNVPNC